MTLVNESGQPVSYNIKFGNTSDCGNLDIDGLIDLPGYDNQQNVTVSFSAQGGQMPFTMVCGNTGTGQQVEMALIVELGQENSAAGKSAK